MRADTAQLLYDAPWGWTALDTAHTATFLSSHGPRQRPRSLGLH